MQMGNITLVTEFVFTGLTDLPQLQVLLFVTFLAIYAITLVGNVGMIVLIRLTPQLHTPMYFFLSHLSFLDICYSSSVAPKFLTDFLKEKKVISFAGCFTQFYFYALFAVAECYLLAAMAYDRYVAICNPLLYLVTMSPRMRVQLIAISYWAGIVNALVHTIAAARLSYCGPNVINNFYCEVLPILELACSDTSLNHTLKFVFIGFTLLTTNLIILISYTYILATILKIRSTESRQKAFSTCSSHLMTISISYASAGFVFIQPSSRKTNNLDKIASVFYTVMTPMLNPFIYSLRNKEVKSAFRNILGREGAFQHT